MGYQINKHILRADSDEFHVIGLAGRKIVGGSSMGGMKETQEMFDFASKNNITADIEVVPMDYLSTAMERLSKTDVRYRFVIDIGNSTMKI